MHDRALWIRNRKDHLKQIRALVDMRLRQDSPEVQSYTKSFQRSISRGFEPSNRREMLKELARCRVLVVGDFHAHIQSQRVIRRLINVLPQKWKFDLAVEFFEARHQKHVDAYMLGEMSGEELQKKIRWPQRWGFNWSTYEEILIAAKKRGCRVLALNRVDKTATSLEKRDQFAAEVIAKRLEREPERKLIVIFGELHLAKDRLPLKIQQAAALKSTDVGIIYQNPERIYFRLAEMGKESVVDVVRLARNRFAIMGTPPWVQWQSYLLYLEKRYDSGFEDEDAIDIDALVIKYVRLLCKEFRFKVSVNELRVYTAADDVLWNKLQKKLTAAQFRLAKGLMIANESLYIPKFQWAYLSQISVNHVTSIAGHFLHAQLADVDHLPWSFPKDFERLIWTEAVAFFFSKWVNPHRKANTLNDLKLAVADDASPVAREVMLLALDQTMSEKSGRRRKYRPRHKLSYFHSARILGGMLGEKLYYGYIGKRMPNMRDWLKVSLFDGSFDRQYEEILSIASKIRVPYKSKRERF